MLIIFSSLFYSPLPTVLLAVAQFASPNHNPWTLSTVACPYCSFAWVVSVSLCGCCCCCCDCCWVQNARHCLQSRATKLIFQVISRHLHGAPYTRYTQCARAGTSMQAGSVSRHEAREGCQNKTFHFPLSHYLPWFLSLQRVSSIEQEAEEEGSKVRGCLVGRVSRGRNGHTGNQSCSHVKRQVAILTFELFHARKKGKRKREGRGRKDDTQRG